MLVLMLAIPSFFPRTNMPTFQALFPDTLSGVSVPEFLEGLTAFDDEIEARRQEAAAQDAVLRYVASVKEGELLKSLAHGVMWHGRFSCSWLWSGPRFALLAHALIPFSLFPSSFPTLPFHITSGSYEVGLKSVPKAGPIGSLRGTDNILSLTSEIYSGTPLVIQGSGAGADITAAGVIADMVDIATRGIFAERR